MLSSIPQSKSNEPNMKNLFILCLLFSIKSNTQAAIPNDIGTELITPITYNIGVRHAGDGSNRKFVIIQTGEIRILDDADNLLATPFLDISGKVQCCGEQGFLGLAFHPNYEQNGYFYVNYTKSSPNAGDTIIERYQVSQNNPNVADPNSGTVLMRIEQDFPNHNGGDIAFGADGFLYIGMGDGGSGGDPNGRAQDLSSALGKMLRIDVDNDNPPNNSLRGGSGASCPLESDSYAIPSDNPFIQTQGACPEIWAYGLRNPWRWSFDRENGDLYIGDVGQTGGAAREEVNYQAANSKGGEHYGWNCREGFGEYENGATCLDPLPIMTDPILVQNHANSRCAVTGGYNYRGPIINIQNKYIYADYCSGQIWLAEDNGGWSEEEWVDHGASGLISGFGEDEEGNLYISTAQTYGSPNTFIYKITGLTFSDDIIFKNDFEQPVP